jgi:hypothetical protein
VFRFLTRVEPGRDSGGGAGGVAQLSAPAADAALDISDLLEELLLRLHACSKLEDLCYDQQGWGDMLTRWLAASIALGVILNGCANPASKEAHSEVATDPYLVRWQSLSRLVDGILSTAEGVAYEHEFVAAHNVFWRDVARKCRSEAQNEPVERFSAIAVIDRDGTITEFLPKPNSPHFRCYTTEMIGRHYPKPPISPFYERFHIAIRPPVK